MFIRGCLDEMGDLAFYACRNYWQDLCHVMLT
jgi:hypothetical protein